LKCPSCGIGFIPIERKTRVIEKAGPASHKVLLVAAGAVAVGVGFLSIWLAVAIVIVALLAGIFVRLGRITKRQGGVPFRNPTDCR
jgi:hypothetical protein